VSGVPDWSVSISFLNWRQVRQNTRLWLFWPGDDLLEDPPSQFEDQIFRKILPFRHFSSSSDPRVLLWGIEMDESKHALRVAALSQRDLLPTAKFKALSRSIQARVLGSSLYRFAKGVALYSAVQNEVNTDDIRDDALHTGKTVFFPRLGRSGDLVFVEVQSAAELKPGRLGILEPNGEKLLAQYGDIDLLIVVPGVAFDHNGNRLGRGQGCYDRVLQSSGPRAIAVGLAYEFQLVNSVPVDSWDKQVQFVVTEDRFVDCQGSARSTKQVC
jgi:5-formyltetrahydrofolate cyclo-ligase